MKKLLLSVLVLFSVNTFAADKTFNITANPIGLLFGVANLGVDVALADQFTLGANFSYFKLSSGSTEATSTGFGVRAQYYFTEALADSWYLAGGYEFGSADAKNTTTSATESLGVTVIYAVAGYMWMWTNFNIQLGFGMQSIDIETPSTAGIIVTDINGTIPAIEFKIGYAF